MPLRKTFYKDNLKVEIFGEKEEMGKYAAEFVAGKIKKALNENGHANIILGTGTSQFPLHKALIDLIHDWSNINLFHLDEYIGLSDHHPASFRKFLKERVADLVHPGNVYYLNGDAEDPDAEIKRYTKLLKDNPVDVACIGIGENGHIAFNDPAVADFNDPEYLKVVELDDLCRKQQVGEGWFPSIRLVPQRALTLTIPAIMNSKAICCTVPDERKSEAVFDTLNGEISTSCPASILRKHNDAVLFLDTFAATKVII